MYINQLSKREQEVAEKYIKKAIDHLEGKEAEAAFTDAMNSRLEDLADFLPLDKLKKAMKQAKMAALEDAINYLEKAWSEMYAVANPNEPSPYHQIRHDINHLENAIWSHMQDEKEEQK